MHIPKHSVESRLDEWPVRAFEATFDASFRGPPVEDELPPLWHWLYFWRAAQKRDIGADGHPIDARLAEFVHSRRRMFAAARVDFVRPLRLGRPAQMIESLLNVRHTTGSHGPLTIVTLGYHYTQDGECCIAEERDIIYVGRASDIADRPHADPVATAAIAIDRSEEFIPDPVLLFQFSALTYNAHRIHYDQQYAREQEGYRERLVQGPLIAIMLAELLRKTGRQPLVRFEFRARQPLFVNEVIGLTAEVVANRAVLRAMDPAGQIAMQASALHRIGDISPGTT